MVSAVDVLVLVSMAVAWLVYRRDGVARSGGLGTPGAWLLLVTMLLILNQVLVTVYILRVHDGDAAFIQRYLGPGWFHLERSAAMRDLASHWPAPALLAPSVLRIPALLELPFTILAYLTVARWFGAETAARRLIWPAAISYSVAFGLVEWELRNPYTGQDLVLRAAAAIAVPLLVHRLAPSPQQGPLGARGLVCATLSTAALGWLVLACYDTVLLYNLADLPGHLPGIAVAAAVLGIARLVHARGHPRAPGAAINAIENVFAAFVVAFFVPALAIRYAITFGTPALAAAAGLGLALTAVVVGLRSTDQHPPTTRWPDLLVPALTGGTTGAACLLLTPGYAEMRILAATATALVTAISVGSAIDRAHTTRG